MNKQKKILGIVLEGMYLLVIFAYMLILKNGYSSVSVYDFNIFLGYSLFILGILVLIGPKWNKYIGFILSFIYTLYLVAQRIYYRGFSQYFRFSTALGLAKEVSEVGGSIKELMQFSDFIPFICLLAITVLFIVVYQLFTKNNKYHLTLRLICIPFFVASLAMFIINNNMILKTREGTTNFDIYKSDYYVYDAIPNTNQFVDKFGLLSLSYRDCQLLISNSAIADEDYKTIDSFFNEKNKVHNYNDMTGIFKDKSLLIIQAESLIDLGISEELTPNLYYYMNKGIKVEGFNTPLLIGSTSDTEFMSNTSIIPMSGGYPVCYEYINNTYPNTLGNIFKDNGYNTYGYHNNYAEYYNRNVTFDKYGYEFFDSAKLGLENLEPDSKLAETIGWILSEKDKYLGYWVTYSGHQPYNLNEVGVSEEDVQKIKELYPNLNDEYVAYLAKNMDLDRSIANFINVMDWTGKLNDFVIILYGDHVVKGLDFSKGSNYDEVFGINSDDNPEILNTPLIIYANDIEHKDLKKSSTALDIMPTVINLWGFDVDTKYMFGRDIFDDEYHGFSFDENGNYVTNDYSYNVISDSYSIYNDNVSVENIKEEIMYFDKMKDVCRRILRTDYFKGE